MDNILCVELDIKDSKIYYPIENVLCQKTIIEEGKCIDLSIEEKKKNHLFFQYAINMDNCYYLKYNNNCPPKKQLTQSIFDGHISINQNNSRLEYIKQFDVDIKTRTNLISVITNNYKALHNYNIDNDIYTKTFTIMFCENTDYNNHINTFICNSKLSDLQKYQDLLILQFMIYNLYIGNKAKTLFKFQFSGYYKRLTTYKDIDIVTLPEMINKIRYIGTSNIIFNKFNLYIDSSKFKKNIEHKTINFLTGADIEY